MDTTTKVIFGGGFLLLLAVTVWAVTRPPPQVAPDVGAGIERAPDQGSVERTAVFNAIGSIAGAVGSIAGAVGAGQTSANSYPTSKPQPTYKPGDTWSRSSDNVYRYSGTLT